jgi:hypothetical protein
MPREITKCRWHHKKRAAYAVHVGETIAKHMFEMFSEPSNCGPKFTWLDFPDMMKSLARVQAGVQFPGLVEDKYYDLAATTAYDRAVELIQTKV